MPLLNWLHLTDWHQGRTDFNRKVVTDALLDDIRERAKIHPDLAKIDFLFFTGDLAFKGAKEEYEAAIKDFLDPVVAALGIDKSRVITIPGNHDIERGQVADLNEILRHRFPDLQTQTNTLGKNGLRKQLSFPFEHYEQFIADYGHRGFQAFGGYEIFPFDKVQIGVFGCNSALMCAREYKDWPDGKKDVDDLGNLMVSEEQLRPLIQPLRNCHLVFGLVHHPFSWLTEFEKGPIQKLFRDHAQIVLMGHEHEQVLNVNNRDNVKHLLVNGGATYDKRIATHPINTNSYTFGSYDLGSGKCRVFVRSLNYLGDQFRQAEDGGLTSFKLRSKCQDLYKQSGTAKKAPAKKNGAIDLDNVRKVYLNSIVERYRNLDQRGVLQGAQDRQIELDAVYVTLTVESKTRRPFLNIKDSQIGMLSGDWSKELSNTNNFIASVSEKASSPNAMLQTNRPLPNTAFAGKQDTFPPRQKNVTSFENFWGLDKVETKDLAQLIREGRLNVILGDPGAGKTTLAKFLTRHYAQALLTCEERVIAEEKFRCDNEEGFVAETITYDYGKTRLPILVRVGDYAEALKQDINSPLIGFLPAGVGDCQANASEIKVLFEDAMAKGEAFVILDGLDEVTEDGIRSTVSKRIDDFVSGGGKQCPILITSRKTGFEKARPTASFEISRIQDMDIEQVRQFVARRIMAFERGQTGVSDDKRLYEAGKEEIGKILHAIETNEGVRRLSVNPLLLTILCLIHRSNKSLPKRRVELYRAASEILLTHWRVAQTGEGSSAMSLDEADIYLAPLAEWMHKNLDNGLIPRGIAREKITEIAARRFGENKDHPDVVREVEAIWRKLTYDTSVFVDRGDDHFAFLHLTFEEYWAARQLVRDSSRMADKVREHRKDPRFREVIRLAVASRSEADAAALIRSAIWCSADKAKEFGYQPSLYEAELHRDFELACECLADCSSVAPDLVNQAALRALKIWESYPDWGFQERVFAVLAKTPVGEAIASILIKRPLNSSGIRAIVYLGVTSEPIVEALLTALKDTDPDVRYFSAQSLGQVAQGSERAIKALHLALKDEDSNVHDAATQSLDQLVRSESVLTDLLSGFQHDDSRVRSRAALNLGLIGQGSDEAVEALLVALQDESWNVRSSAAQSLVLVGRGSGLAVESLRVALRNSDWNIRHVAALCLGQLGQGFDSATQALLGALKDGNVSVRNAAAQSLGQLRQGADLVVESLSLALSDDDWNVRFCAAQSLDQLGHCSDLVVQCLLEALCDKDQNVRYGAARILGQLGQGFSLVVEALLIALNDEIVNVRNGAARSLGQLGQGSDSVMKALLIALKDRDWSVRNSAAQSLGQFGEGSDLVINALRAALTDDDSDVRRSAAESLRKLAPL